MPNFPVPFEGHRHRKLVELDHTLVPSDQKDFETFIIVTDSDLRDHANHNGFDILFADEHHNLLEYERTTWDPSSGSIRALVLIPQLSSSVDTKIWMYFGRRFAVNRSRISPRLGPPIQI